MKPVAISCGEPAGIGPEIAVAAWRALKDELPLVWIGDPAHLPAGTPFQPVGKAADAKTVVRHAFPVMVRNFGPAATPGIANPAHAQGVIDAIRTGVELVVNNQASALCTAPIHKAALIDGAGFQHPGHTEYLAALAETDNVVMMLACKDLRVVPATIHIPISAIAGTLTEDLLSDTLQITHQALQRDFGIANPRIAVAGLNPHAGESGNMGREEIDLISPLLTTLRAKGMDITGPLSADTMFHAAARATYDVAVCMYHDQALIPIKTLDFSGGVNVTLGLPFIRTSPDHGTAFDIAGQGKADATSMIAAIRMAADMAATRGGRSTV